ncbi:MAG: type II toxin-antitoxin system death-on-curing family toxin [Patescibacteria group bacterium]|nr:type II toxin-antitoxin system death-on-curing family toxin [Patescibacteria group bacterium]
MTKVPTLFLTLEHIKDICFILAQEYLSFNEPIPDFDTRFPNKLEAILEIPKQGVKTHLLYPAIIEQSGVLFYSLIKEHPFLNGNKRLAVTCFLTFLHLNKLWLKTDWKTLYGLTIFIANSDPSDREKVLKALNQFIQDSIMRQPKTAGLNHKPSDPYYIRLI